MGEEGKEPMSLEEFGKNLMKLGCGIMAMYVLLAVAAVVVMTLIAVFTS